MTTLTTDEASVEHIGKVTDLTIAQVMSMDNDGLLEPEITNKLDDIYYYLLDNVNIRKELENVNE